MPSLQDNGNTALRLRLDGATFLTLDGPIFTGPQWVLILLVLAAGVLAGVGGTLVWQGLTRRLIALTRRLRPRKVGRSTTGGTNYRSTARRDACHGVAYDIKPRPQVGQPGDRRVAVPPRTRKIPVYVTAAPPGPPPRPDSTAVLPKLGGPADALTEFLPRVQDGGQR